MKIGFRVLSDFREAVESRPRLSSDTAPSLIALAVVAVVSVVGLGIYFLTGIGPDGKGMVSLGGLVIALLVGIAFCWWRRMERELLALRGICELIVIMVSVGLLSYAGTAVALPLRDSWFHAADRTLGFDWAYWVAVMNEYPRISRSLSWAYGTMLFQTFALVVLLGATLRRRELNRFLLAYLICGVATVVVGTLLPGITPLVYLGLNPADYPNVSVTGGSMAVDHIMAMREGKMRLIDLHGAQGLICFPSFHTISAVLLVYGFWGVPYVRWFGLMLNAVMLVSIPVVGLHYLVDVLAGGLVGVAGWYAGGWLMMHEDHIRQAMGEFFRMRTPRVT
ncbi:hypothetical protein GCM10019059_39100 [Camelimonas fluminis]|uniref:Phosphatase PAP2 family protein n=1 Tax=Camelimonas fluminis TaxID=1576911 RepID=A0ABV7UIH7_9HYPH|nr:phosphatase PAP2 family protein [Camelimonas fluminis]GHE75932.1 hypothetical protein GCM10019059_39100 [Camelimonas fluminis]